MKVGIVNGTREIRLFCQYAPEGVEVIEGLELGLDRYILGDAVGVSRSVMEYLSRKGFVWYSSGLEFSHKEPLNRQRRYLGSAKALIFQSPEHRSIFSLCYGFSAKNMVIIPLPLSLGKPKKRSGETLFVDRGDWSELISALDWARSNDKPLIIYTANFKEVEGCLDYPKIAGGVVVREIEEFNPKMLEDFGQLVCLPSEFEPFNELAAYAVVMGLEVIGNKNVGVLSYNLTSKELRKAILEAPNLFWEVLLR